MANSELQRRNAPGGNRARGSRLRGVTWESTPSDKADDPNAKVTVQVNSEGEIQSVNVDQTGAISFIKLRTGEVLRREPRTLNARLSLVGRLLLALCFPVGGFLLPWGAVRLLVWVVDGFFATAN